ncbi:MAG: hypothetical protein K0U64_12570 [Actinomycetia bacterium]|nr:hypothetical protein [Actinomycetes bacterium]
MYRALLRFGVAMCVAGVTLTTAQQATAAGGTMPQRATTAPAQAAQLPASAGAQVTARVDGKKGKIGSADFGIHSFQGTPGVAAGSVRLACAPTWAAVNPAPGEYDWEQMDYWVDRVENYGYSDILFAFCSTPEWAAKPVARPDDRYLPGSVGQPRKMSYWRDFLEQVVQRYRGRITSYETWNEATSRFLYQGSPKAMAKMTRVLYEVVQQYDSSAQVLAANVQASRQINSRDWLFTFWPPYLKKLKRMKWPVDALSIHSYADIRNYPKYRKKGQTLRPDLISGALKILRRYDPPKRLQIWDTETNNLEKFNARGQRAVVARTYLDSFRLGIDRTYWYMWTTKFDPWMGTQMMAGTASVAAYDQVRAWTKGKKLRNCQTERRLTTCRILPGKAIVAWSERGESKLKLGGKRQVCDLASDCRKVKRKLKVRVDPVWINRR